MKRSTIRHPKLIDLATRLAIRPYAALGLLDALLDWTYTFAPCGDVGRWDDVAIAAGCTWDGDPQALIQALAGSRWLDPCAEKRLVIHDLEDHADDTWRRKMARGKLTFCRAVPPDVIPEEYRQSPDSVRTASANGAGDVGHCTDRQVRSGQVRPGQVRSGQVGRRRRSASDADHSPPELWAEFLGLWEGYPNKHGRHDAWVVYRELRPTHPTLCTDIATALVWQRRDPEWLRGFVPRFKTYLNGRRWEDEPSLVARACTTDATAGNAAAMATALDRELP